MFFGLNVILWLFLFLRLGVSLIFNLLWPSNFIEYFLYSLWCRLVLKKLSPSLSEPPKTPETVQLGNWSSWIYNINGLKHDVNIRVLAEKVIFCNQFNYSRSGNSDCKSVPLFSHLPPQPPPSHTINFPAIISASNLRGRLVHLRYINLSWRVCCCLPHRPPRRATLLNT